MALMPYVLTILAVLSIAAGQFLFKLVANRMAGRPVVEAATDLSTLLPFALALVVYGGATVLWILALRDLPLSRAYMFMALSFVIVPLLSRVFYAEALSGGFLLGLGLIVAGLIVTQVLD